MNSVTEMKTAQPLLMRWILGRRLDLVLFVGTPLLILPLLIAANSRWSNEDLFLVVSTFGALGHHAPGLMRAYGDRQLFRRFWIRFTLAPIILLTLFTMYTLDELPGVMLLLLFWGLWHFLMQTYGFARIYDAKTGSFDATTRRLDLALCVGWTGTCILFAPDRVGEFLSLSLKSGLDSVLRVPLDATRTVWLLGTVATTFLFFANVVRKAARKDSVNVVKIVLFLTTFSFFWLCAVSLKNFLLGIAMFELFHDIQYLGIVWLFNRNRVVKDAGVGGFTRFMFRPGSGLIGAYLGVVVAYGFIGYAAERLATDTLQHVLFAVVASSNVLHFYYDGFIWKIREPETSRALGVNGNAARNIVVPGWLGHALKWSVLLAIAAVFLVAERNSTLTEFEQTAAIAKRLPASVSAQNKLAKELVDAAHYDEAIRVCRAARRLSKDDYRTDMYLGVALTALGETYDGFAALQRAFELNPNDSYLRFHLAMGKIRQQRYEEAVVDLEAAVNLKSTDAIAHYNLGVIYLLIKQEDAGVASLRRALEISPEYPEAQRALANAISARTQAVP